MNDLDIESDLYDIILNSFTMNEEGSNIGCALNYKQKNPIIINYTRLNDFSLKISKVGLFVFRTRIGFLWYEVEIPLNITVNELILFQNEFKELAYERFVKKKCNENHYLFEIKHENQDTCFLIGDWIDRILAALPFSYSYFAKRRNPLNKEKYIADKAILCNYVVFDQLDDKFLSQIFRLVNGYNNKYILSEHSNQNYLELFHHAYCCTTMNGIGYYVVPEEENKKFYLGLFKKKIAVDYFLLNLLVLYQSYSIMKFTQVIQNELSAESSDYADSSDQTIKALQRIETEINVFLIKSVYSSVSHIDHQNEYYEFLFNRWKVNENISSLTIGVGSLQKLQEAKKIEKLEQIERQENKEKEKINKQINIGLGLFSVFAIISAIADGNEAIEVIFSLLSLPDRIQKPTVIILWTIICVVGLVALTMIVKSLVIGEKNRSE